MPRILLSTDQKVLFIVLCLPTKQGKVGKVGKVGKLGKVRTKPKISGNSDKLAYWLPPDRAHNFEK